MGAAWDRTLGTRLWVFKSYLATMALAEYFPQGIIPRRQCLGSPNQGHSLRNILEIVKILLSFLGGSAARSS